MVQFFPPLSIIHNLCGRQYGSFAASPHNPIKPRETRFYIKMLLNQIPSETRFIYISHLRNECDKDGQTGVFRIQIIYVDLASYCGEIWRPSNTRWLDVFDSNKMYTLLRDITVSMELPHVMNRRFSLACFSNSIIYAHNMNHRRN